MATNNKVVIKFLADTDQMRKGINQVNGQLSAFSKAAKTAGTALIAAFGTREVAQFIGGSITAIADLNEAVSKSEVVFGDNAAQIQKWSEDSRDALLLTKEEALSYASTIGFILEQTGFTTAESAQLSTQLVQLAADLASLNNVSVEQAFTAVRGAIVGEREALKSLGVVIQETDVKQEALTLGLIKQNEELTTQAKVQANISLLMKRTATAQGDVERTGDSLTNQIKKLNVQARELQRYFGEGLIEGFGDTAETGNDLLDALENLEPQIKAVGKEFGELFKDVAKLFGAFVELDNAVRDLSKAFGLPETGIIEFGGYLQGLMAPIGNVVDGLALIVDGIVAVNNAFLRSTAPQLRGSGSPLDANAIGGSGSPINERELRKTGDALAYVGSELGYTEEKMTEWILDARKTQRENEELEKGFRGAGGSAKKMGDEVSEAARIIEEEFQRALEEMLEEADRWRESITSKLDIGSAYQDANNADSALAQVQKDLEELRKTPVAQQDATFKAREAELVAEAERLGKLTKSGFLGALTFQADDAEALANNIANLDAAGVNKAILDQIIRDPNGLTISQNIVDSITNEGYGVVAELEKQAGRITAAGDYLGETMIEPLPAYGATGGSDFLFGVPGKGKKKNGLLKQVKNDAPAVKKVIKNALRTSVEVKVIYTPDTSQLANAPGGMGVVRSIQGFERLNGSKWRDRVR
jgi:hypothetical protein